MSDQILFASAKGPVAGLSCRMANRHGLIAGATGTGKTITLQKLAEGFSQAGVPVFMADVKGDLAGLAMPGQASDRLTKRITQLGIKWQPSARPVILWDLLGEQGVPLRTTISELGPQLLARLLALSDVQAGVLALVFRVCDDNGWLLIDLKDLRAAVTWAADNAADLRSRYGSVSGASAGAIQRALLALEDQGGDLFFGEPALDLADLMHVTDQGQGVISILAADKLIRRPQLYATFLLWLLAELFEQLPEAGDLDRPKLVFFFDEAHLLFDDAPAALVDQVEQMVRLIRSKGVGVYFVTQSPLDVPDDILGQLGNRVQHALRAFTPRDQKAVKVAAETFRPKRGLNTATAITELAVGEALVSVLDEDGTPTPVERALIHPPTSRLGPLTPAERAQLIADSPVIAEYRDATDRHSAYEMLAEPEPSAPPPMPEESPPVPSGPWTVSRRRGAPIPDSLLQEQPTIRPPTPPRPATRRPAREPESVLENVTKTVARTLASEVGRQVGRQLIRGLFGALKGR